MFISINSQQFGLWRLTAQPILCFVLSVCLGVSMSFRAQTFEV